VRFEVGGNKMECPKCKKEMKVIEVNDMFRKENKYYRCANAKCLFFGIDRHIDTEVKDDKFVVK
jgi:predicted RNA-binding Zn-ribbon protein involved in translation (DUF1610 family)